MQSGPEKNPYVHIGTKLVLDIKYLFYSTEHYGMLRNR